jgi:CRP-like cAMP-binding protein
MLRQLFRFHLFEDLADTDIAPLEAIVSTRSFLAEETIFEQGDRAAHLYLLVGGSVSIRYKPYDGPALILNHIHAGGVFGWSAVLGNKQYTSSVICDSDCETWIIRGSDLHALCRDHPETGQLILDRLAQAVSGRWQHAHEQVRSMLAKGVATGRSKGARKMADTTKEQQLETLLEQLSAYIEQFHGGKVDFVSFENHTLKVKLGGACLGCPLSPMTLHGWVEGTVRQFFPDVNVESV